MSVKTSVDCSAGEISAKYASACLFCGLLTMAGGLAVLGGWVFDIASLKSVLPGFVSMKANTAVGFVLAGLSLTLLVREGRSSLELRISQVLALVTALIGFLTLCEYCFRVKLGIDQLLFREPLDAVSTLVPGRMAPSTALNFILLGCALSIAGFRRCVPAGQGLVLLCGLNGILPLIGYMYSASGLTAVGQYTPMAVNAAVLFLLMSIGVLTLNPSDGFMRTITSDNMGGWLLRHLLPLLIGVPFVLGWLQVHCQRYEYFDSELGEALMMFLMMFLMTSLVWWSSMVSNQIDLARKQSETKLKESEERFRLMIEGVTDYAIIMLDPKGGVVNWNTGAERLKGYRAEEIIGEHFSKFYPDGETAGGRSERELATAAASGRFEDEGWRKRKDGSLFWANVVITALHDEAGKLRGFAKITRDITDRKKAEEALKKANAYNRSLIEASLDPLVTIGPDGKITDVNGATESITGCSRNELVGTDFFDYFDEPEKARAGYKKVFHDGLVRDYPLNLRHRDGHVTPVLYNASVYRDERGEVTGVFAAARDISERRRAEEDLRRVMGNLERSNRELEQFAYVASHDLQEPLRMVSSYTQLLAQRYEGQLDDKAKKYIDYAVDGAVRMQRLINDLLTYSRVNTKGKAPEPIDSRSVLGEALQNLSASIEENRAIVATDDLPMVRADASQLAQVFQNLIGNAIKFRGKDAPRIHVSADDLGCEWRFSVRDNGIGIDSKFADKIFLIFQRLHTSQEYPGTGIGLAVCKRVVERHGGSIWFESVPGEGTTFHFTLPKTTRRDAHDQSSTGESN